MVLQEHYDLILEALGNVEEDKASKAEAQKEKEIEQKWAMLVKALWKRNQLREKYGA